MSARNVFTTFLFSSARRVRAPGAGAGAVTVFKQAFAVVVVSGVSLQGHRTFAKQSASALAAPLRHEDVYGNLAQCVVGALIVLIYNSTCGFTGLAQQQQHIDIRT